MQSVAVTCQMFGMRTTSNLGTKRIRPMYMRCRRYAQNAISKREGEKEMPFDLTSARVGQVDAIKIGIQRIEVGEQTTSQVLPTGYGKSDIIALAALDLWEKGVAATSLVIEPNIVLRRQIIDDSKVKNRAHRYRISGVAPKFAEILTPGVRYNANGEFLLSATIQLVQNNADNFADWIRWVIRTTNKRVIVFVDEVHTCTNINDWGRAISLLKDAGAHIWVLTATPYRDDGAHIIGFRRIEKENEPVTINKTRPGQAADTLIVQVWEGTKTHYELEADYALPFSAAWEERAICKINRCGFDIEVETNGPGSPKKWLSDLSDAGARKCLGKVVWNHEFIRKGVIEMVARLKQMQGVDKTCAAIIFTANDEDGTKNAHANVIKKIIHDVDSSLYCIIATSADDEQGTTGVKAIEGFAAGRGDILIVKQMASIGLDIERLKVVLDLSPVRTVGATIQRTNRATRIYHAIEVAHLIAPDDVLARANWTKYIEGQNGAATSADLELIHEYEIPKEEKQPSLLAFTNPRLTDFDDTDQRHASRNNLGLILRVLEAMPFVIAHFTFPQIVDVAARLGITADPLLDIFTNTGDILQDRRAEIVGKAKVLVQLRLSRTGERYSQPLYAQLMRDTWIELYRKSECSNKIEDIRNLDEMGRLQSAIDSMLDQEMAT